jgi:hypothetical protein
MKDLSELLLNSGEDGIPVTKVKSPADEPKKVNAFMKKTGYAPFIYHPPSKSYRFRTVFVEKAAREAEELKKMWWWIRRKELKLMEAKEMKRKAAEKAEELKRKVEKELKQKEAKEMERKAAREAEELKRMEEEELKQKEELKKRWWWMR